MKVLQRQPCIHISKNRRNLVKPNMSKLTTLLTALLLFTFMLSYSATARPDPTQLKVVEAAGKAVDGEESCEGVGKEGCLKRKTLEAHLDYIYTQDHTHP